MRIWLDMANSPHPVLFRAVGRDLEARGHELLVTTRDHAQTKELTLEVWPDALVVGGESPGSRPAKAKAIADRITGLYRHVRGRRIDVSACLNSYAQVMAARAARIPAVTLMDYEFQPANHLAFRLASRVAVPSVFPDERLRHFGARPARVARFDGYKEEMYLDRPAGEAPDVFDGAADAVRAVFRPPAEGALYHPGINERFEELLKEAASRDDVELVVLPRLAGQRERYARLAGARVPETAVDALSLLRSADVFVGAGGTMSREAALLGLRAYTVFGGELPAVDRALIESGRLGDLRSLEVGGLDWEALRGQGARAGSDDRDERLRRRGERLRGWFVETIENAPALRKTR